VTIEIKCNQKELATGKATLFKKQLSYCQATEKCS